MKNIPLLFAIIIAIAIIFGFKYLSNNMDKQYEKYHLGTDNSK